MQTQRKLLLKDTFINTCSQFVSNTDIILRCSFLIQLQQKQNYQITEIQCQHQGVAISKLLLSSFDLGFIFTEGRNLFNHEPGPEVIKLFSCSAQLSMKFFLLINVKMPTIVGILTLMSRKNNILGLTEPEKCCIS